MTVDITARASQLHVVHVMYRFAAGGLENVVVQLINGMDTWRFKHTIVALTTADVEFSKRITQPNVEIIAMHKVPGQPFKLYPAMYRLLRRLRPDVLHSCNIAALEFVPVAAFAGVPLRVHAEHGWDVADPQGHNKQYQLLRMVYQRFVHQFVAVSDQLQRYLIDTIGLSPSRVHCIPNGVDTEKFRPPLPDDRLLQGFPFNKQEHWVIGTVGRLEPIKNQPLLARAFVQLVQSNPPAGERLRLAIVGAGPLASEIRQIIDDAGLQDRLWLPGTRNDIPEVLRALDCFVLPSLSEGTSCTLQEALASSLPVVATDVGGNAALLGAGTLGTLVPSESVESLTVALGAMFANPANNTAARDAVVRVYSLPAVIKRYADIFSR
jgi:sugar transferase (PEP-CTERM/EpsH1 system associated)